ncbi:MAG: hypothetical protein GC206_17055 [Alphaproteobacteria bacterium]|nr:hypothetical protein [Alphaproteobacteria bacterium]
MSKVVPLRDAQALNAAREFLEFHQTQEVEIFGVRARWLNDADNRRVAIAALKRQTLLRPETMMDVVELARAGWPIADAALRELILEFTNRGEVMPTYLAAYSMEIVSGRTRKMPGRQVSDKFLRDIVIVSAVMIVSEQFDMPPTGRNISASSVVAEALSRMNLPIGYKGVAKIWAKYGHMVAPDL